MYQVSFVLLLALAQSPDEFHRPLESVASIPLSEIHNPEKEKLDANVIFDETLGVYKIRFKYKNAKKWETATMERCNQIDLTLKTSVERETSKLIYTYHFDFGPSSKQTFLTLRVQNFTLVRVYDSCPKGQFTIYLNCNDTGIFFKNSKAWSFLARSIRENGKWKSFGIPSDSGEIRMESEGLPCLVECQAEGEEREELKKKDTTQSWGRDDLPLITGELFKNLTSATYGVNGKTLGPGPFPPEKDLGLLLGHILGELDECQKLGWIKGDNTLKQIKDGLEQVRVSIIKGNRSEANVQGNTLIKSLETMQNKTISCEVYGLVRYNLEYALSKI